jgi:hypothetical protein
MMLPDRLPSTRLLSHGLSPHPIRLFTSVEDADVRAVDDLYSFYELGALNRLMVVGANKDPRENLRAIYIAEVLVDDFISIEDNEKRLPGSIDAARTLLAALRGLQRTYQQQSAFPEGDISSVHRALRRFQDLFAHELKYTFAYIIEDVRGYSAKLLLTAPLSFFSSSDAATLEALPFAHKNLAEAAKCIAFNRWTATGFHALRAVEEVTRCYYAFVTGRSCRYVPQPTGRERYRPLAQMAGELSDEQVTLAKQRVNTGHLALISSLLARLSADYRDPLTHPEIVELNEDEAANLFIHAIVIISDIFREIRVGGYVSHHIALA